ncbi:MAG: lysoplasmalogenase family protein [Xanthomarina gelatinilytica]|uniref:lysoplasmalogenase family protein n=1 Tax=Xanthomarina gelatinilytica TaxID=1137281 RepID=UPI003A8397BC
MARLKFKNHKQFTFIYFLVLAIDITVKLCYPIELRYFSKSMLIPLLLIFYYQNKEANNRRDQLWVFLALTSFLIGDVLIINHLNQVSLAASLLFFTLGKLFFSLKFIHKEDFNVVRLIPFSILLFAYIFLLVGFVYQDLNVFFSAAIVSFFFTLVIFQFAFLRKGVYSSRSYYYVFFGVLLFLVSESIMAIKTFKQNIPYQDFLIMLAYGTSIYLITMGIVFEKDAVGDNEKLT